MDFREETSMTQLHLTTFKERAVMINQPDAIALNYVEAGPPRKAYVPAWDNPERVDQVRDYPLCQEFCQQKVWCGETYKVTRSRSVVVLAP